MKDKYRCYFCKHCDFDVYFDPDFGEEYEVCECLLSFDCDNSDECPFYDESE